MRLSLSFHQGINWTVHLTVQMPPNIDIKRLIKRLITAWEMTVSSNPLLRRRIVKGLQREYIQAVVRESIPLRVLKDCDFRNSQYAGAKDIWHLGKPLVRVSLQGNSLVALIHHAIYNGTSWPMIFRDVKIAYQGQVLPTYSFAPFIKWICDITESTRQFWINKFANFHGETLPPLHDTSLTPKGNRIMECNMPILPDEFTVVNKLRLALAVTLSLYHNTTEILIGGVSNRRTAPVSDIAALPAPTG
ncbi:hypothetical protein N7456_008892 [Penicillium angulare]|uniref:Condensation domain-containing protein n=1 Tax=Penicillium angulare TaxID=116970 RepID=A0A9W9K578_9EURO|nr:hypothetical protein N7456_008892 [Penicillium angulare]